MKRILILLLALVMCLGCFAACTPQGGGEDTTVEDTTAAPEGDEAATLAEAVEYLRSIYKDSAKETPADYDVVGKIVIGDTEFAVTWTTDNADIVVKVSEKNAAFYTIDIPVKNDEVKDYNLTATVTDANGQSESLSFERALPVYDSSAIVDKPEEQQAYKLYLIHAGLGQTLFATGETDNSKFLKTTTDPKAAMDFYSEADGEGFKFYYLKDDGTKMYLLASTTTSEDGKVSKYLNYVADQSTTWTYKSETNGWYTTIDGIEYVMGTYGSYNTMSLSEASYLSVENSGKTQFPAGIMKKDVAESMTPSEGPTIYNTPEEIVNAVYALDIGGILSGGHKYTLTGVITSIPSAWSDDYGNITVVIVVNGMEDKPIECFRLKGDGADKLAVGDTITVTGELLKYDNKSETGKVEFNAGCTLVGGATAPETTVTNPTADGVYKLYLIQVNTGKTLFANGETDQDKFLKATTDPKAALDFRAEIVEGGFKFYTEIGGVKKYLNAHTENVDGKISKFLHYTETSETVWYYKAETNAWYTTIDGAEYVAGTYNSFDTFSISDTKFMTPEASGKTQFPLSLVEKSVAEGGNMGGSDKPDTPDTPDVPVDGLDAQAPVAGTAYKFGFIQGNQNKVYYLTGVLSGFYMASTETFADGADFYVEETNGGFHLYCMVNGAKKYVNAASVVGTDGKNHINGLFEDTASSVYTYDETLKTLVTKIDGTDYIYGTRNDKTYSTLGPMKADSGCFYAVLVVKAGSAVTPDTPDEPDTPDTPDTSLSVSDPVANKAYKLYLYQVNTGKVLFANGETDNSKFLKGAADAASGLDFYAEVVEGGYRFYTTIGGAKKYLDAHTETSTDGKVSKFLNYTDSTTNVWYYKAETNSWYVMLNGAEYVMGTYNSFDTLSMSDSKFMTAENTGKTQFPGNFVEKSVAETADFIGKVTGNQGGADTPETPDIPVTGNNIVLSVDTLEIASQTYAAGTTTLNGVGFEYIQMGNYGDGLQMRDKNGNTSSIWNTTAISGGIARIELVYSDTKSTYDNPDAVIFTFGNAVGEATCTTKLSTTSGVKTYTITPDAGSYTYFKLEHDLGYTFYWKSITIVFTDGSTASIG